MSMECLAFAFKIIGLDVGSMSINDYPALFVAAITEFFITQCAFNEWSAQLTFTISLL